MDDESKKKRAHAMQIVADGRRLVEDVEATLAATERWFALHNIDRVQLEQAVQNVLGDKGQQEVQAKLESMLQEADKKAPRQQQDNTPRYRTRRVAGLV
jgi:hypothetical protein